MKRKEKDPIWEWEKTEILRLRAEVERLREALRWYGQARIYVKGCPMMDRETKEPEIMSDAGRRARKALGEE